MVAEHRDAMAQTLVSHGPAPAQLSSSSAPLPIEAFPICDMEQKLTLTAPPPSSSKVVRNPTRPGYGKVGEKVLNKSPTLAIVVSSA
ncbi:hypothetical protein ACFX13_047454 [Malus domestica]